MQSAPTGTSEGSGTEFGSRAASKIQFHDPRSMLLVKRQPLSSRADGVEAGADDADDPVIQGAGEYRSLRPTRNRMPPEGRGPRQAFRIRSYRIVGRRNSELVAQMSTRYSDRTSETNFGFQVLPMTETFPSQWSRWVALTSAMRTPRFPDTGHELSDAQQRSLIRQAERASLSEEERAALVHFLRAFRLPHPSPPRLAKRDKHEEGGRFGRHSPRTLRRRPLDPPRHRYRIIGFLGGRPVAQLERVDEVAPGIRTIHQLFGTDHGPLDVTFPPTPWREWQWLAPEPPGRMVPIRQFGGPGRPFSLQEQTVLFNQLSAARVPVVELGPAHTFLQEFRLPPARPPPPPQPPSSSSSSSSQRLDKRYSPSRQNLHELLPDHGNGKGNGGSDGDDDGKNGGGPPLRKSRSSFGVAEARPRIREYRLVGIRHGQFVAQMRTTIAVGGPGARPVRVHNYGFPPPTLDFHFSSDPWTRWQRLTPPDDFGPVPMVRFPSLSGGLLPMRETARLVAEVGRHDVRLSTMEELNLRRFLIIFRLPPHAPRLAKRGMDAASDPSPGSASARTPTLSIPSPGRAASDDAYFGLPSRPRPGVRVHTATGPVAGHAPAHAADPHHRSAPLPPKFYRILGSTRHGDLEAQLAVLESHGRRRIEWPFDSGHAAPEVRFPAPWSEWLPLTRLATRVARRGRFSVPTFEDRRGPEMPAAQRRGLLRDLMFLQNLGYLSEHEEVVAKKYVMEYHLPPAAILVGSHAV